MIFAQAYNNNASAPSGQDGGGEAGGNPMLMISNKQLTDSLLFDPETVPKLMYDVIDEENIDLLLNYAFSDVCDAVRWWW